MSRTFKASAEQLPPSDPRDAAIKSLNAKCRQLIEIAHTLHDAENALITAKACKSPDIEKVVSLATEFGTLEERFYNLRQQINDECRNYNQHQRMNISLVYTDMGMPIRVSTPLRKRPWE